MSDVLTREIVFDAAFDRRDPDPKKNYGIHGVTMRWYLKGPKGIIQFVVYTNWQLPHVNAEQDARPAKKDFLHHLCRPMAADLGYHSPVPMYEGHEPMGASKYSFEDATECFPGTKVKMPKKVITGTFTPCELLDGKPCYYDGSSLRAEEVFKLLVEKGGDAVWEFMERDYHERFDEPIPDDVVKQ